MRNNQPIRDNENTFLSHTKVIKALFSDLSYGFGPRLVISELRVFIEAFLDIY